MKIRSTEPSPFVAGFAAGAARGAGWGAACGALAAALTALADFGAHWLWLGRWADRGELAVRLLATQVPVGAWLGAVLGIAWVASGSPAARRASTARAVTFTLLASPAIVAVAVLLFSGGKMSQLPGQPWLQTLTAIVLLLGCTVALYAGLRLLTWAARARGRARTVTAGMLVAGALASKLDQYVLPNLYEYLHGALTVAAWLLFGGGIIAATQARPVVRKRGLAFGLAALPVLTVVAVWNTLSLEANQNVRVALMSASASHSRSLMHVLGPLVLEPRAREAHRLARERARARRRAARRVTVDGPVIDGAHVLLITVDALRTDHVGTYGYARPTTPAIDAFARNAVVFERAYTQAPHSSYALASIMTSEYLHETLDVGLPPPAQTLASVLTESGYHTAGFYTDGVFHTAGERLQAYQRNSFHLALHDVQNRAAEDMTDRVLEEVDRIKNMGEPSSLLWVHYFDAHEPYVATHFGTSDMDRYDSEILRIDAALARLVKEVRSRLSRDVIVAITADHGEEFREHGGVYHGSSLYDEQVRVPLIIDAPTLAPRRVPQPVETVDLAPTLLGLVGVPRAASMRGRDLRPAMTGAQEEARTVFSAVSHKKMALRWPYKLIADLRFGLFQLHDLERDPRERDNMADREPALLASLKDEVYGWLDTLVADDKNALDERQVALERGHLGDRRATPVLITLVGDETAPKEQRIEAARILGRLADSKATGALLVAMRTHDRWVAAEAAIALGRLYDGRARDALRSLVSDDDPSLRDRSAVSLARLRDPAAVPALIDALHNTTDRYEREEAVRWLGRLRDPRGLDALIDMLPEPRTRYLVVIAMGLIGDDRAYDPLIEVLQGDRFANVRDSVVRGLGLLGDKRAIDVIVPMAVRDPTLKNASESLVRLGAIESGAIGGTDVTGDAHGVGGLDSCWTGQPLHDWDYLHRTFCTARPSGARLRLRVPERIAKAPDGAIAVLSARRTDAATSVEVHVSIDDTTFPPAKVDGSWSEVRWEVPVGALHGEWAKARISTSDPQARVALDHLLLLPHGTTRQLPKDS